MAEQKMSFEKLYVDSKSRIAETIINMWKENSPKMVEKYAEQLKDIISKCISNNIVVENMAHWEPAVNDDDWRKVVNEKIWSKKDKDGNIVANKFRPYKHQYESWKTLLNDNKSIVVTSGTGSGKTECFMVPLVHDLTKEQNNGVPRKQAVEALFLYPLNALMEDQKERMDNYIAFSGKDLKFAVYNGNTPEDENSPKYDNSNLYDNEILTRREIREKKPNILFTNPSMLEYMLLRNVDSDLFTNELKWIVIDETHTYKGSAGAELAMLLRRVLKACGKTADEIKFATSSATIGSGDEAKSKLKEFISQITGQSQDKIEVIEGHRTEPNVNDEHIKESLKERDFVLLKELIQEGSVIEKLEKLDALANNGLRVRLHYYLQTLNMGLYVDPRETKDGQFVLNRTIPLEDGKLDKHYLDAYYCKECGALLGYGEMDAEHKYSRKIQEEVASLEDYAEDDDNSNDNNANVDNAGSNNEMPEFYVGLNNNNKNNPNDGLWKIDETGDKFENKGGNFKIKHVELNKKNEVIHCCPCCGAHGNGKNKPMRSFHMSADYISRLIAPILLEQTTPANENTETLPYQGRKYITFADSRQSAAGPTLKQNLETEEVWVTGVLYNYLREKTVPLSGQDREILEKERSEAEQRGDFDKADKITRHLRRKDHVTWCEALQELKNDKKNFERMFLAFAKPDDRIDEKSKNEYALSALYRVMAGNKAGGKNSPENWGLICTYYPVLDELKKRNELPDAIEAFNNLISDENLKITNTDWYDYVKIFIDYDIRRNENFFFKYEGQKEYWDEIDYSITRQYRTEVSSRRPIDGEVRSIQVGDNHYTKRLLRLLNKGKKAELNSEEKDIVSGVIEQLKNDLEKCKIKEVGQELNWAYDQDRKKYVLNTRNKWKDSEDENNNKLHYMNLSRIAFKLYDDKVWFDNNLRIPISTTFKGYSPEYRDSKIYDVKCDEKIAWTPYNKDVDSKKWFEENRKPILHKWTSKLKQILEYSANNNTLYVQAEHTAQVARSIIKEKTDDFKKGEINIMACSTTMEMGVDLGDLELVLMNNVPPHPANYKQRAGRAGRGDQNKSASVTICGCDSSGNALMQDPLKNLICAPIEPPKVDLTSPQLIQRHVNSYLLRKYFNENGIRFNPGIDTENDNGYKLFKFFTEYEDIVWNQNERICEVRKNRTSIVYPQDYESIISYHANSAYKEFIKKIESYALDSAVIKEVGLLVENTFKIKVDAVDLIRNTKDTIQKIAEDLDGELAAIKKLWDEKNCNVNQPNNSKSNPWKRLNYQFTSILSKNLLSYLSTHQFTPNANMPVGIVEMVIDDNERHSTDNPSRDMRTALSEYAPGKMVFINGVTYLMGGVKWNHSQGNQKLRMCSNGHTWFGEDTTCKKCNGKAIEWGSGFGDYMEVMTPTGFYPYKDTSRITQKDAVSLVLDTALIGVGNWKSNPDDQRLYMIRTNEDYTGSQILYYNKGLGRGYYVCKECGYAVPVPLNVSGNSEDIQKNLYPIEKGKEKYHNYRGWKCKWNDADANSALKNIVFGGAMQTDYCEIALFEKATQRMSYSENNNRIAYTLGLILCREFAKRKNCDVSELDFIVRRQDQNLSICIFDTAKGGVGYSNSINAHVVDELFDKIRAMLKDCKSADKILDRTTMRKYADFIDVKATYEWLEKELEFRKIVPEEIIQRVPNARVSCYNEVESAIMKIQAGEQCALFFNGNEINKWDFDGHDVNWSNNRGYLNKDYPQQKTFAVYNISTQIASSDKNKMNMSSGGNEWKRIDNPLGDLFPIAQVGRTLYFTDKKEYSVLNGIWASGYVYSVDYDPIVLNELNVVEIGDEHYTFNEDNNEVRKSDGLFDELYNNSEKLREFIKACKGHELSFTYHEEYLRTHLGMTITLQFIQKFAKTANSKIKLINIIGENYDDSRLYNAWNYDEDEQPKKLYVNCLNDDKRDGYIEDKFLKPMLETNDIDGYCIESVQEGELPHWRALIVKDEITGAVINILPNGGFANGWEFDNREYKQGGWFPSNCNIDTAIPIKISDSNGLLYDIKVGELK